MKRIIVKFLYFIGKITNFFLPVYIAKSINKIIQYIYTGRVLWGAVIGERPYIQGKITISNVDCISIGNDFVCGSNGILTPWKTYRSFAEEYNPNISIGDNVIIGDNFNISAINRIEIGNNVLMGRYVTIIDHGHGKSSELRIAPNNRPLYSKGRIVINDDVWIGDKVTILSGVTIGKGAVIGANSVVTKDVKEYSVVAGVPAVIISRNEK